MYISDSEQLLQYSRELVCLYYVECTLPALNRALVAGRQEYNGTKCSNKLHYIFSIKSEFWQFDSPRRGNYMSMS